MDKKVKTKPLVMRLAEAETELVQTVNGIMAKHEIPCFLFEPIIDKIHRQVINGAKGERSRAEVEFNTPETEEVK